MKRAIRLYIVCPIEIDDDVDITDEEALHEAEVEAVGEELFSTEYLCKWDEQIIQDIGKWED